MFERFSNQAKRALIAAEGEASSLGDDRLEPEHILLGLLHIGEGLAFEVLSEVGVTYRRARRCIEGSGHGVDLVELDADALASLGIDVGAVRAAVDAIFGEGAFDDAVAESEPGFTTDHSPFGSVSLRRPKRVSFSEQSKSVLPRALQAALALDHHYIGTEHLLLALLQQPQEPLAAVLRLAPSDVDLRGVVVSRLKQAS